MHVSSGSLTFKIHCLLYFSPFQLYFPSLTHHCSLIISILFTSSKLSLLMPFQEWRYLGWRNNITGVWLPPCPEETFNLSSPVRVQPPSSSSSSVIERDSNFCVTYMNENLKKKEQNKNSSYPSWDTNDLHKRKLRYNSKRYLKLINCLNKTGILTFRPSLDAVVVICGSGVRVLSLPNGSSRSDKGSCCVKLVPRDVLFESRNVVRMESVLRSRGVRLAREIRVRSYCNGFLEISSSVKKSRAFFICFRFVLFIFSVFRNMLFYTFFQIYFIKEHKGVAFSRSTYLHTAFLREEFFEGCHLQQNSLSLPEYGSWMLQSQFVSLTSLHWWE